MKEIFIESIDWSNSILVDTRSSGEFETGHIDGAISLPILDNEQRAKVGVCYKKYGQEKAIELGLDLVGNRFLDIYKTLKKIEKQNKTIVIYCARGGMRSGTVVSLMESLNINCFRLVGGYKGYRNYVLSTLEDLDFYNFIAINGYTGSGKTEILKMLEKDGFLTIDFEEKATHAGSVFGKIPFDGEKTTQQQFENRVASVLYRAREIYGDKKKLTFFVEAEGRRVGDNVFPKNFYEKIKNAKTILIELPFDERVKRVLKEYPPTHRFFKEALTQLKELLGGELFKKVLNLYDSGEYYSLISELLKYYDKKYAHSIDAKKEQIVAKYSGSIDEIFKSIKEERLQWILAK
ncbi:tRNA 2-selenouridine(34) synthase MnmH [bacterium]|nr:tRNA 2-selenouridine(34) synthase MnmH [bacterium]